MSKRQDVRGLPEMMGPRPGAMLGSEAKAENISAVLRRLWDYLRRRRRGLFAVAVLVAGGTALTLVNPYLISIALDDYIAPGRMKQLAGLVLLMIAAQVLAALATWGQTVVMVRLAQETLRDLRRDLFAHLTRLPLRYFDTHPHGEVMSRLTNDTTAVNNALSQTVTQLISSVLSIAGAGFAMALMNWRLALITLATTPFVLVMTFFISRAGRRRFRNRQRDLGILTGLIEETVAGQKTVLAYRGEADAVTRFDEANRNLRRSAVAADIITGIMGPMMNMARNISFAVIAAAGAWMVLNDLATIGVVAAFINYSQHFTRPLNQIAMLWGTVQSAIAGAERVFGLLDETPEPEDTPDAVRLDEVRGEVEFDHVEFGYEPKEPVLHDVTFTAKAGETVAIVGTTGAGKTTIINLLSRFYDIASGVIRLDGHDLRHIRRDDLRNALGIVLQDTFLMTDTVRENIRYGRLDATDAQVEAAAEMANATGFINRLPHGFDTVLHEAGGSLSQGQRQLIAIARVVLADPRVLILDEATSSVDTRTELHIQKAMLRLMQGRTAFVIAHRLSTVRNADRIMVIENGRIVEHGTHEQLLAAGGAYHRLYQLQFGGLSLCSSGMGNT